MMTEYQGLFQIEVMHDYFTNKECSCLEFVPTKETQKIYDSSGLIQQETNSGILILFDKNNTEALLLNSEGDESLCFEYKIYSQDVYFRSYTEPYAVLADAYSTHPGQLSMMGKKILYFDNLVNHDNKSISVEEFASKKDLKDPDSRELCDVVKTRDNLIRPEFVVKIFARQGKKHMLQEWIDSSPVVYNIKFNARKTHWKYYILGKMAKESVFIHDPDNNIEFEYLGKTKLSDERMANAYRSKKKIELRDIYSYRFQLKDNKAGTENVLINRLPVACIDSLGKDVNMNKEKVVSEIYINSYP